MLQETTEELLDRQSAVCRLACSANAVAKRDLVIGHPYNPVVRERNTKDVGREILQRGPSRPDRPAIDHPGLLPGCGRDLTPERGLAQRGAQLGPKQRCKWLDVDQKVSLGCDPGATVVGQAAARYQVMHVRVVAQVARPGLQDTDEAELRAQKAWVAPQLHQCRG